jgi:uncharacterized membrane protein
VKNIRIITSKLLVWSGVICFMLTSFQCKSSLLYFVCKY